jgi:hypothetical protein
MRRNTAALILTTAVTFLVTLGVATRYTPFGCALVGGRFGPVPGTCTTPACYYLGGCGQWSRPLAPPCSSIAVGTSAARVHFMLGAPSRDDGTSSYWWYEKSLTGVKVTFHDGRVSSISCFAL